MKAKKTAPRSAWKPGQSGNPKGRPKGRTLTDVMKEHLEKEPDLREALVAKLFTLAKQGDIQAMKLILAYTEGGPISRQATTLKLDETPLPVPILAGVVLNKVDD